MSTSHIKVPAQGQKIVPGQPIPDNPIIPFIEGDGIGVDITPVMQKVVDAAVQKSYGGKRKISWMEVYAGEKATRLYGPDVWLPAETITACKDYSVSIKGPLTTPVGGGIRSLNVALRQEMDLYQCVRPVRYFKGIPSPLKDPSKTDMVIFRENTEDIYCGVEWQAESAAAKKLIKFLQDEMDVKKIRFPDSSAIGIKPVSEEGSKRLIRAAILYAIKEGRPSVTLVHKGNLMKYAEGAFRDWGYELAREEFGAVDHEGGPWQVLPNGIIIKDVIATLNLNGDYLSDALAAQVGGIGIAPGGNINYVTGHAIFEATHGTAPKYANQDVVNPGSVILSGELMFRHLGWNEAADLIIKGLDKTIGNKTVTYDFHRQMEGATKVKCSEFGDLIIKNMG